MELVSANQAIDAYLEALLADDQEAGAAVVKVSTVADHVPVAVTDGEFACRLFDCAQLPFAVPQQFVTGATALPADTPSTDGWQAGNLEIDGTPRVLVDVARLILPAAYQARLCVEPLAARAGQLLLTNNGLALAVDAVVADARVDSAAIRWRSAMGRRPWLAGVCIDPQAILLDTDWLARAVATGTNSA